MKNQKTKDMLERELTDLGLDLNDCKIAKEDYNTSYGNKLSKNPKALLEYKKNAVKQYNETNNINIFLEKMKVIAIAEGNIAELARKSKMHRTNIYKILSKDSNPTHSNLVKIFSNLGIKFKATLAA